MTQLNHQEMPELKQFQDFLRQQGLSEYTVSSYSTAVRQYYSLYSVISAENLQSYKQVLICRYQTNTVNTRIQGINRYLEFADSTGELRLSRLQICKLPTVRRQQASFLDTVISDEDYRLLKRSLKEHNDMLWYFVVRFLGASGARVGELIQIKIEHLTFGYMDLASKGGKIRRIYFPESLCQEALDWYASQGVTSGFLFLNRHGCRLTPRGISWQLKRLAKRYGVDPSTVYPHSFRHRFAKNFLLKCGDITLLADLMGHESIETTRIYLTRSTAEQRELIDRIVTW